MRRSIHLFLQRLPFREIGCRLLKTCAALLFLLVVVGPVAWKEARGQPALFLAFGILPAIPILMFGLIRDRASFGVIIGIPMPLAMFFGLAAMPNWHYKASHSVLSILLAFLIATFGFGVLLRLLLPTDRARRVARKAALLGCLSGLPLYFESIGANYGFVFSAVGFPKSIGLAIALAITSMVGFHIGIWLEPRVTLLRSVWPYLKAMGGALVGFASLYLAITLLFASYYWASFACSGEPPICSINGLSTNPSFGDFVYFSVVTIATLGYGDVTPVAPLAKLLSSLEVILGVALITVGLAAVLAYLQPRFAQLNEQTKE